jgi:histidyl-tRNA synthetase
MAGKNKLISARLPRGFEDRWATEIGAIEAMIGKVKAVYERYGFDPVETPLFEYTEALGKFLPDTDRPNAGVFSLQDDDEQWLSLRYDLTAPLARHFAENFERLPKPYRTYRAGYVFRNEKPGPGRFRQFLQLDADTIGAPGPEADAEMAMMMADTMDALGLAGKYVVKVNNRKLWDGALDALGLTGVEQQLRRLTVLRAIDKLDRLGLAGVSQLLGEGRVDESGDKTEGAGLDQPAINLISRLLGSSQLDLQIDETNRYSLNDAGLQRFTVNPRYREALDELSAISRLCLAANYNTDRIRVDFSVVRGLEYYTGPVFEIELTFPVTNERGEKVVFGSVGGGGRYDGLVSRFRSEPVPATGFSIGVSRLATALRLTGNLGAAEPLGPVVVLVMDRDQTPRYQEMVSRLRNAGIRAEMFLGATKNLGKQLAYADRRNAPAVVIEGGDERARGVVQVKDLAAGKAASATIADNAEWKAERPGQFECPTGELVARIAEIVTARTGTGRP